LGSFFCFFALWRYNRSVKILFCGDYDMTIQDQVAKFTQLPYETKKTKVVGMLDKLK
jgi:hypothetical protein